MDVNLIMFREDGSKRVFPLSSGVTVVGRKNDCGIRIPLAMVSRQHAQFSVEDGAVTVRDLGTANGTFLNNKRVDRDQVEPGDQIIIGPVVFTVQIDGNPSDEELVAVKTKVPTRAAKQKTPGVRTSEHVLTADDEIDPISALEALASSADATAIHPEEEDELP